MVKSTIKIKREKWTGKRAGYHSVGRENGRFVAVKKWKSSADTKIVRENVEILRPKYVAPQRYVAPRMARPTREFRPSKEPPKYLIVLRVRTSKKAVKFTTVKSRNEYLTDNEMQYHTDRLRVSDEYNYGTIYSVKQVKSIEAVTCKVMWSDG
jgi:hypothetical protein